MTPDHAAMAGLSADHGCEGSSLGLFDVASRDPAVFRRMVKDWSLKLEGLFLAGRVLEEPPSQREVGGYSLASATFVAVSNFMPALLCSSTRRSITSGAPLASRRSSTSWKVCSWFARSLCKGFQLSSMTISYQTFASSTSSHGQRPGEMQRPTRPFVRSNEKGSFGCAFSRGG